MERMLEQELYQDQDQLSQGYPQPQIQGEVVEEVLVIMVLAAPAAPE